MKNMVKNRFNNINAAITNNESKTRLDFIKN